MSVSFEEIVQNSLPVNDGNACGIYFLILNNHVVYVGQSRHSIHARIKSHLREKTFDRYFILPCEPEDLDYLETKYIAEHTPVYNRSIKTNEEIVFVKVLDKGTPNQETTLQCVVIGGRLYANLDSLNLLTRQQ